MTGQTLNKLAVMLVLFGLSIFFIHVFTPWLDQTMLITLQLEKPRAPVAPALVNPHQEIPTALHRGHAVTQGGIHSGADVVAAVLADKDAAKHYAGFNVDAARLVVLDHSVLAFVSYRIDGKGIYWTSNPVLLLAGDLVLTDGVSYIRAACGNRIAFAPVLPVAPGEEQLADTLTTPGTPYVTYTATQAPIPPARTYSGAPVGGPPVFGPIFPHRGPTSQAALPSDRTVVILAVLLALAARFGLRRFTN